MSWPKNKKGYANTIFSTSLYIVTELCMIGQCKSFYSLKVVDK